MYILWFLKYSEDGKLHKAYDIFTGTKYLCYKLRNVKDFRHQYRVCKAT
jgi:hypothetical protein